MKQKITKTLLIIAGLVVALIICEVGLRLMGIGYPDFYENDPCLGSCLRPGIEGYYLKEGGAWVSINSDGMRDREHAIKHPPNTLRIAVLGDSFSEAMQVNQDETFWAIMEKNLQGCPGLAGRQVEVLNFGQAGFGVAQEFLALRHRAWKYSPDVVLLALFTDDVRRNTPGLMEYAFNPYFSLEGGKLVLHDKLAREEWEQAMKRRGWAWKFARWRQDHFRVFQLLDHSQREIKTWWSQLRQANASVGANPGSEAGLSDDIYCEPRSKACHEAWQVTEALLVAMRDEIAARGAKFYVVVLTNGAQVDPDPAKPAMFAKSLGVPDLLYADRRLEKFCQQQDIPILLLAPAFQQHATADHVYLHGFKGNLGGGHWNQKGHRLAGDMIVTWLCGQISCR
jgi:hypothetical protein